MNSLVEAWKAGFQAYMDIGNMITAMDRNLYMYGSPEYMEFIRGMNEAFTLTTPKENA